MSLALSSDFIMADFATLLRTTDGILIAGDHITPALLRLKLKTILRLDTCKLDILFNHKDHQNVPNAVELLTALHSLAIHPDFNSQKCENQALIALGLFTGFLVGPYTDTTMCITNQLTSLSAAAHLLFVLYRQN